MPPPRWRGYSTLSLVSSIKASSRDALCGVNSCRTAPWAAASSPMAAASIPRTSMAPSVRGRTLAPAPLSSDANRSICGELTRTERWELDSMNSLTPSSRMRRPRPITIRWSAVSAISLMRWLDTRMVRPSAARARMRLRTQTMPSGSSPLTGSSNISTAGSPSRAAAMPSRCPIPRENPLARRRATDSRPTISSTSFTRLAGMPLLWARHSRWL